MAIRYLDEEAPTQEAAAPVETPVSRGRIRYLDEASVVVPIESELTGILPPDKLSPLQKSAIEALPFRGAQAAYKLGVKSGQDVLGKNLAGDVLGTIFGGATALGTAFNPIAKGATYYTNIAQALGEQLAGSPDLARKTLLGTRDVVPTFQPGAANLGSESVNTTANFITELLSQAANDPVNAGLLLAGARDPRTIQALKNIPASTADLAASIAQSARAPGRALAQRGIIRQPLAAATTQAIGITPIEGSQQLVPVLKSSILEANSGKIPKNVAPEVLIEKAADYKINQYKEGLKLAEDQGLAHSTQSLLDTMRAKIIELHPSFSAERITSIIEGIKNEHSGIFSKDYITPSEGQKFAVQINRDVNSKNPNRVPKSSEVLNAETALSQELSRQGKEMYQASTGTYGTPNQDWGILDQLLESTKAEIKSAQTLEAGKRPGGREIPTTLTGLAGKILKTVGGRALIPTKSENVIKSFQRVLNKGQNRPEASPIDPSFQQAVIERYTPPQLSTEIITSPGAPTVAQIQATIQSLPKEYQGLPQAAKEGIAIQLIEGKSRLRPKALLGEVINKPASNP